MCREILHFLKMLRISFKKGFIYLILGHLNEVLVKKGNRMSLRGQLEIFGIKCVDLGN